MIFLVSLIINSDFLFAANPSSIHRHGLQLGKKKMYKEAVIEFDRAANIYNKKSAMVYHNKAYVLEMQGDIKGAIENYAKAVDRYPRQIPSGESLGFLYYKTADYANAVKIGEMVLKIDPENKAVPKWLPDAYLKKLQQEKERLLAKKRKEEEDKRKKEEEKKLDEEKRKKEARILLATFDFMIRTGYYPGSSSYTYISDPGIVAIAETLYVSFTPTSDWQFDMTLENPYLGALSPNLVIHNETFEGMYKLKDYTLGLGFMFNHYKGDLSFNQTLALWDVKVGFIFGLKKKKYEMKFSWYPRFLPRDSSSNEGETLDVDNISMDYVYTVDSSLQYYSLISSEHYYLFDHGNGISDFWGVMKIGFGVTLGNMGSIANKVNMKLTIEFIQRFYLKNSGNTKPYSVFNGQGFMGMDFNKWMQGDPFSGFRGTSSSLNVQVNEEISKNFFLYQKVLIEISEMSGDSNHHEFNFQLGVGVTL
ncbi:MAG: tetratricopeptide repeat protein [bacterium]|nr:tetratricopeptide repeat protein [bacterium]